MRKKKIILSAGGTGGHLFPAQALASELHDYQVLFVAGGLAQNRFFDRTHFSFEEIDAATFSLSNPLKCVRGGMKIMKGIRQSKEVIRTFAPDLVVGFGSFYTLPLLLAAKRERVPIILHEQNACVGKVNRLFSRYAHTTALTFPIKLRSNTEEVQFPLRKVATEDPWAYFGLKKGDPTLLVFGGSQGAAAVDALVLEAVDHLPSYQVLHFTGRQTQRVKEYYQKRGIPHCVKAFEPKLQLAMHIADLAITRAGACTLAELKRTQTPAILIPYPYATDNHQEVNAQHFLGGEVLLQHNLTGEKLAERILHFPIEKKREVMQIKHESQKLRTLADLIRAVQREQL